MLIAGQAAEREDPDVAFGKRLWHLMQKEEEACAIGRKYVCSLFFGERHVMATGQLTVETKRQRSPKTSRRKQIGRMQHISVRSSVMKIHHYPLRPKHQHLRMRTDDHYIHVCRCLCNIRAMQPYTFRADVLRRHFNHTSRLVLRHPGASMEAGGCTTSPPGASAFCWKGSAAPGPSPLSTHI